MATVVLAKDGDGLGLLVGLADSENVFVGDALGVGAGDRVGVMLEFGLGATAAWQLTRISGSAKSKANFPMRPFGFIF